MIPQTPLYKTKKASILKRKQSHVSLMTRSLLWFSRFVENKIEKKIYCESPKALEVREGKRGGQEISQY